MPAYFHGMGLIGGEIIYIREIIIIGFGYILGVKRGVGGYVSFCQVPVGLPFICHVFLFIGFHISQEGPKSFTLCI
jgi:hypothetical protein